MKGVFFLLFLTLAGLVSAQTSQGNDTLDIICQKWKPEMVTIEMDSTAKESFKKAYVVFTKEGSYISYIANKVVEKGSWKYLPDKRQLVCEPLDKTDKTIIDIDSISKDAIKGTTYPGNTSKKITVTLRAIK